MKKKKFLKGKDELNICECPLTLLTKELRTKQKTLEFTDRQNGLLVRHWIITGSDKYGLPCAGEQDVLIGLLALTRKAGFENRKIYFKAYELLKLMNWGTGGPQYKRLELALCRLAGTTIYTNYWWNNGIFKKCRNSGFHLISFGIPENDTSDVCIIWDDVMFESFQNGNLKDLDCKIYFSLQSPTSKSLYRLLDKRLYKKNKVEFDLLELVHERLGVSRKIKSFSKIKRAIEPALIELQKKNIIGQVTFPYMREKRMISITKYIRPPKLIQQKITPLKIKDTVGKQRKSELELSPSIFEKVEKVIDKMPSDELAKELAVHRQQFLKQYSPYIRKSIKNRPSIDEPVLNSYKFQLAKNKGWI